jgi:hypothetical protein
MGRAPGKNPASIAGSGEEDRAHSARAKHKYATAARNSVFNEAKIHLLFRSAKLTHGLVVCKAAEGRYLLTSLTSRNTP